MLGTTYYHETIRKYVAVFGTLFNDINIQRRNSAGVITEQVKVPIAYEARDKLVLRTRAGVADGSVAATLPRMGFVMNGITYDGTRKLNTMGQVYAANTAASTSTIMKQFNPVPYNFDFALTSHDLRRTFATICDELGIAVTDIAKLLNHSKREVTDNYIVRSLENQRDSYNKVIDELEGSLRIAWGKGKESYSTYGVKNAFRYLFYGQPQELVYMDESLPKPTYWDNYMATPQELIDKDTQEQYHKEGRELSSIDRDEEEG